MAGFRSYAWDPLLIISQMIAMQAIFYFGLGSILYFLAFLHVEEISLERVFISTHSEMLDLVTLIAYILNCFISSVGLWYVVQRSKQCLDFTITIHFWHFILTFVYAGFPRVAAWWGLTIVSVVLTTLLGEYLCRHTELQDIPIMGNREGTSTGGVP